MQIGSLQPYEMKQYEIAKLKDYSVNDLSECIKIWLFCSALTFTFFDQESRKTGTPYRHILTKDLGYAPLILDPIFYNKLTSRCSTVAV